MTKLPTEKCDHCGQRITYWVSIGPGVCDILKDIAAYIKRKGINAVHPVKELEPLGKINSTRMGNLTTVKRHGLLASIDKEPGNYAITQKGFDFLNGQPIPMHTKVSKAVVGRGSTTIGHDEEMCTITQFKKDWADYWVVEGFSVHAGRVINTPPVKSNPDYKQPTLIEI